MAVVNRADRLYAILKDGRPHSRHDILHHAYTTGGFYLTNNAASELRARGLIIQQFQQNSEHFYRLLNAPDASSSPEDAKGNDESPASGALSRPEEGTPNPGTATGDHTSRDGVSGQLTFLEAA